MSEQNTTEDDLCALAPVRRMAALLDLDPGALRDGDLLPRGWHVLYFNATTPQSQLDDDGYTRPPAGLGLERPRLMLGGRRLEWRGDLAIGQRLRRTSRLSISAPKIGRSGPLVRATRRNEIAAAAGGPALLIEEEDLMYLGAPPASPRMAPSEAAVPATVAQHRTAFRPDERLLFRYSALTYNAHRIHYDLAYATAVEGYPALVVNGGLTALFLLQFFRTTSGQAPARLAVRNRKPLFCGRAGWLQATQQGTHWTLWATNELGETTAEMEIDACSSP